MTHSPTRRVLPTSRWSAAKFGIWLLAALAYVPSLTAAPGRMPTDTKLYLYLDPGRLITDAPFSWDIRQFAGWVPHQTIAYLWPSGPWFWVFEHLGVPDWVAHRLWIGTILFLGGLGIRWAARLLGLAPGAALVAAVMYQLSPYVLPYVSRTSVMLLPWAGVGWLVALTIRACGRTRWRDAALFALVVLTVGAVNATATALIAPAPILWLVHAVWQRTITWRTATITAVKLGSLSLLVSMWWVVMLVVQGRHGADVLAFSETLRAVSLTSTSPETLRGLGYWLFYVRDAFAFTTTASIPYMSSGVVMSAGYGLLVVCLVGLAVVRWSQRRYAAMLVFTGIVLAVGVHPFGASSPLMRPLQESGLGLALRSSTRAIPVSTFGLALAAGSLVSAVGAMPWQHRRRRLWRLRNLVPVGIVALAIVNLPALHTGAFVDPALERDQYPPAAWTAAAAALDAGSDEYRVLQLPGSEFGAFRWGYTVDPPLPGLTTKPLVTRDLLPLGSPGAMDLLYALDNRIQSGTLDPDSLAPVARLLGVDTIWLANDLAFDRFRTPRPEIVADDLGSDVAGLGTTTSYGEPEINVPQVPMIDEQALSDPRIGTAVPQVELVPVDDPQPIVRATDRVVLVSGSGDGLVEAAAAGLLDGREAVLYTADLPTLAPAARAALGTATPVILTDSNRDRATQWRGSQDVTGFTESGGPASDLTKFDDADQRLAVFPDAISADHQTIAVADTGLRVTASGYGEPYAYRPEDRPSMAVDGDPATAWVVADRADPVGQTITVSATDGQLHLVQAQAATATRRISTVEITFDGQSPVLIDLGADSLSVPGQTVDVSAGASVTISIVAVVDTAPAGTVGFESGPSAVGFAELGPVAHEVVRLPIDAAEAISADTPLSIVLSRDRVRPTDRWRTDPEANLARSFSLPVDRKLTPTFTLRLDQRASDELLSAWDGKAGVAIANRRLTGVGAARGLSAVDGDPSTAWTSPFGQAIGSTISVPLGTGSIDRISVRQPADETHSRISVLHLHMGDFDADVPVPAGAGGVTEVPVAIGDVADGDILTITVTGIEASTTVDRRYGERTVLPVSIIEVEGVPISTPTSSPITACRTDLVTLDGEPLSLALDGQALTALRSGAAVDVGLCSDSPDVVLNAGSHLVVTAAGATTGVDIDRIVFDSRATIRPNASGGRTSDVTRTDVVGEITRRSRSERTATVTGCANGCWLILGEGYNSAWHASMVDADPSAAESLGAPTQISGGFNGWWLPPGPGTRTVTMTWTPQPALNLALGLAGMGVLACIGLALFDRRQRASVVSIELPAVAHPAERTTLRAAVLTAAVLTVTSAIVVAPSWAVIGLVFGGACIVLRRTRWLSWSAAVFASGIALLVIRRELVYRFPVDAAWPGSFEDLHRAGLFVVVLALASSIFTESADNSDTSGASGASRAADPQD